MIILTFCSDEGVKIPHYTYYCIKALRHYNPDMPIHFLSRANHGFEKVFKDLNVEWFDYSEYSTYELEKFKETCDLKKHGTPNTKHPSPPNFFYGAMERLFVLQAHQEKYKIKTFFHLENDVLVYYPMSAIIHNINQVHMYCVPLTETSMTLAISYFHDMGLEFINNKILKYINMGEKKFCEKYNVDMFNEMTCLHCARVDFFDNFSIVKSLVTLPGEFFNPPILFDPGSYGQYLGGTNNEHGPGWAGDHHIIGKAINEKRIEVFMDNGKPMVKNMLNSKNKWGQDPIMKLFNLHLHSKNMKDFIDV